MHTHTHTYTYETRENTRTHKRYTRELNRGETHTLPSCIYTAEKTHIYTRTHTEQTICPGLDENKTFSEAKSSL